MTLESICISPRTEVEVSIVVVPKRQCLIYYTCMCLIRQVFETKVTHSRNTLEKEHGSLHRNRFNFPEITYKS